MSAPLQQFSRVFTVSGLIRALRTLGVVAGVGAFALAAGCQDRTVTLTEFSHPIALTPPGGAGAVVGLILETELVASAPIQLQVGCNGAVKVRMTVPNGRSVTQRIDWYSRCAELSFSTGSAVARSITISYRFQTL